MRQQCDAVERGLQNRSSMRTSNRLHSRTDTRWRLRSARSMADHQNLLTFEQESTWHRESVRHGGATLLKSKQPYLYDTGRTERHLATRGVNRTSKPNANRSETGQSIVKHRSEGISRI